MACDISGAYLSAPVGKKVWFVAGIEMGQMKGMAMVIMRALYGLKTRTKAWSEFFGKSLKEMEYTSCVADPNVWMKPQTNKEDYKYWSYMLVYVDHCLAVHHDPGPVMEELKSHYKLKNDTYRELKRYLGANVGKYQVPHNRETYWSMYAYDYVVESCKIVRGWSERDGHKFNNKREDAMKGNYRPEIDISDELGDELAT